MTDLRSKAFVDVDYLDLEKRVMARHMELVRQGLLSVRWNPCHPDTVALPPRHPATNIGE